LSSFVSQTIYSYGFTTCYILFSAIIVGEEDIATYTIKAIDDPRALNKILYMRPPSNIYSHNELVSLWEKKTGKTLEKIYLTEEEVVKKIKGGLCFNSLNLTSLERARVGSFARRTVMVLRAVGHPSQLMDGSEREREKKTRFVVRLTRRIFAFFSLSSSGPSISCDKHPQREGPSQGPSREGANPTPSPLCYSCLYALLFEANSFFLFYYRVSIATQCHNGYQLLTLPQRSHY